MLLAILIIILVVIQPWKTATWVSLPLLLGLSFLVLFRVVCPAIEFK
jgi:hypothetical protein